MKIRSLGPAVILCLILALGGVALSVGQIPAQKQPHPAPIATADLQIKWITATPCACTAELAAAHATILEGPVIVRVHNAGPRVAEAILTVLIWQNYRSIGAIMDEKRIHLEKNQSLDVVTFAYLNPQKTILVWTEGYGERDGITAEIKPISAGLVDPNLSNNAKAIHGCQQVID